MLTGLFSFYLMQDYPGSGQSASDVVQTAIDSAGDQEGARCHRPATVRTTSQMAHYCNLIVTVVKYTH